MCQTIRTKAVRFSILVIAQLAVTSCALNVRIRKFSFRQIHISDCQSVIVEAMHGFGLWLMMTILRSSA